MGEAARMARHTDKKPAEVKELPTPLNAALKYAEAGYPVLPVHGLRADGKTCACSKGSKCRTPGKHPMIDAWQKNATTDKEQIREWFEKKPRAHVGILPPEGHYIIDVDPRNGGDETLDELIGDTKLPVTPEQNSGGGGYHYVFKYDGQLPGKLGDGIDVKAAGRGFVVAWPSAHASGGAYTWRKGREPWTVPPATLPKRLRSVPAGTEEQPRTKSFEELGPTLEQVREALRVLDADDYDRWIAFGQALKHDFDEDGYDLWLEWSQKSDKYPSDEEAREKWETFDKNPDREPVTCRTILADAKKERAKLKGTLAEVLEQGRIGSALHEDQPEEDWVIENAASRGTVTLLVGPGGVSKTMLALQASVHLAAGVPFGPFSPEKQPRRVVYVTYEDSRVQLLRRVRNMAMHPATPFNAEQERLIEENLRIVAPPPEDATSWRLLLPSSDRNGVPEQTERVKWLAELREQGYDLLILDSLALTHLCSENDTIAMAALMAALSGLAREANIAILALHHVPKMAQGMPFAELSQTSARGATSIVDYARSVFVLTRMHAEDAGAYGLRDREWANKTLVGLKHVKMNHGRYLDSVWFERDGETGVLLPRTDLAPLSSAERQERREEEKATRKEAEQTRKALAVLRALAKFGGKAQAVGEVYTELDSGPHTYGNTIRDLVAMGLVEQGKGGGKTGRAMSLAITEQGRAWVAEHAPAAPAHRTMNAKRRAK
jgi:RecA-family ATPase